MEDEEWVNEMESLFYEEYMNPRQPLAWTGSSYAAAAAADTTTTTTFLEFGTSSDSDVYSPSDMAFVASQPIASQASSAKLRDHSLAERKRREKLSHLFISLSALLPGLKKMDKASILDDAISHMKELQKKVKGLEARANEKTMKSAMRFGIKKEDDDDGGGEKSVLMEARFGEKELLISIHCERRKGALEKVVGEMEKHHLSLVNTSVFTYGNSSLVITLIAQRNEEAGHMSMEQIVKNLRGVFKCML